MARWMEADEAAAALEASLLAVLDNMMIVIFGYVMDRIRCLCYGRTMDYGLLMHEMHNACDDGGGIFGLMDLGRNDVFQQIFVLASLIFVGWRGHENLLDISRRNSMISSDRHMFPIG